MAIFTFRGRCRVPAISKTKLLVTIVNGFHKLTITTSQELHPKCGMDPRSASEFSEISNGKVLFVTRYKVDLSILTFTRYD